MSSPRQLTKAVPNSAEPEHYQEHDDGGCLRSKSRTMQQSPGLHGKKVQTARKSFPKARKTFPSANRTPLLINMNKSDTTGLPSYNIDKNQIIPNQPGKEAEMTKSNSEISLLKSSPTNRDNSIQAAQKSILAEMKKRYTSPSKMYNPITATCVPSSTTDPEAGDDSYEEELVSLSVKLNATPQKTSFSSAEKIDATSTGKVEDVQLPHNTSLTQTSVQSPRPSDEKKLNVPDVHGVTHHPPTPAPTPLKEDDINVEAAMAALHGEPLDELIGVTSTGSAVKQSTDSKLEIHLEQSETEQKVDTESPVKEASSEVPIKQPTPSHEKEAVDPSANFDTSAPEAPSGVSVEKIEKTKIKRDTTTTSKGGRRIRPVSRELESLYIDEGAANILREMEGKPHSKRRATMTVKGACYASSIDLSLSPSPRRRHEKPKQDSDSDKRKRKAKVQPIVGQSQSHQDNALQFWEAVPSSTNKKKVVYAPRPMPPPSGPRNSAQKRSSSESDLGGSPVSKKQRSEVAKGPHPGGHVFVAQDVPASEQTKESDDYKEILLTYKNNFLHVIISSVTTTLHNSLNVPVLRELIALFKKLKTETKVNVVLITSAGSDFCKGIDLPTIINNGLSSRFDVLSETINCIREFFIELANCEKILVAGVHGRVVGIGVAMLPYFDVTYASDKTVFCLPYGYLGQSTEGAVGFASKAGAKGVNAISLMLYEGCKLTADQAREMGLVNSVLGLSSFQEALMPRVSAIAAITRKRTLANKRVMNLSAWRDLPFVLEQESEQLLTDWSTDEFVQQAEKFLDQDFMA